MTTASLPSKSLNKNINVEQDQTVKAGQVIGSIGETASAEASEESHLHFEMMKDGKYLDPLKTMNKLDKHACPLPGQGLGGKGRDCRIHSGAIGMRFISGFLKTDCKPAVAKRGNPLPLLFCLKACGEAHRRALGCLTKIHKPCFHAPVVSISARLFQYVWSMQKSFRRCHKTLTMWRLKTAQIAHCTGQGGLLISNLCAILIK
ncbi:MAG: peptidoglycan DD-metalloendopeptidase family protein [Oscillospiraceae bacterium]